jgi:hypothetical protein
MAIQRTPEVLTIRGRGLHSPYGMYTGETQLLQILKARNFEEDKGTWDPAENMFRTAPIDYPDPNDPTNRQFWLPGGYNLWPGAVSSQGDG